MELSQLEIYTDKKSILKSISIYIFTSVLWTAMSWIIIFKTPVADGRDWALYLLVLIFAFYIIGLIFITTSCVTDLVKHPRKLYSFSQNGYTSHRSKKSYQWNQFKPFYFSAKDKNIVTPLRKNFQTAAIERRGMKPSDFEKALSFLKLNSPANLITKLK